jgi:hypothetical protein
MKRIIFIFSLLAFFFFSAEAAADSEPIGVVIEVYGEVRAENGENSMPLALKDALAVSDTVITGADGRIKILLKDDTIITLGADSDLELRAFADISESPQFNAYLLKGAMRVITGKITEMNPDGFMVSTPHSTVGIRGTIFCLRTDERQTALYVLNTDKTVIFNGTSVEENYKAVAERGLPPQITPLARQEKENIIREFVLPPDRPDNSGIGAASDLTASTLLEYNETHSMPPTDGLQPPAVTEAAFNGTILSANNNGVFSFNVDLLSGNINNAATSGSYTSSYDGYFEWGLSGGKGEFCADGNFEITGFGGAGNFAYNDWSPDMEFNSSLTWITGSASSFDSGTPIVGGFFQLSLSDPGSSAPAAQIILPIEGAAK